VAVEGLASASRQYADCCSRAASDFCHLIVILDSSSMCHACTLCIISAKLVSIHVLTKLIQTHMDMCLFDMFVVWCMQGLSQNDREYLRSKLSARELNWKEDNKQQEHQFTDDGKCGECASVLFSCCCGQVSDVSMDQHH
jgi:hypothetical protein